MEKKRKRVINLQKFNFGAVIQKMNLLQIQLMWEISIFLNRLMRSASCTSSVKLIMRSTTNSINLPCDQHITMRLPTNSTNFTNELTARSASSIFRRVVTTCNCFSAAAERFLIGKLLTSRDVKNACKQKHSYSFNFNVTLCSRLVKSTLKQFLENKIKLNAIHKDISNTNSANYQQHFGINIYLVN